MNVFAVIYNCRAMRRLDTKPVPAELLVKLGDAANQAASGSNMQRARWIVVTEDFVKRQLADLNRQGVDSHIEPQISFSDAVRHHPREKRLRMLDAVNWQKEHMHEIPAIVMVCMEFDSPITDTMIAQGNGSIWPGIRNLILAARALGLGATPTTLALGDHQAVVGVLNLPDTMAAYCLIPVGYPLGNFGPVTRKPVGEVMRWNQWN